MAMPSFLSRHGHHSGTIVGILIIIFAIWFLHSTGIFMYVLFLGIILIAVAIGVHFYKRRQFLKEYGELRDASSPTPPPYGGFSNDREPVHSDQPYQASSGYPPAYQHFPPSATPQPGYQQAGYDNQATPYVPPTAGGNRAYSYNV